MMLGHLSKKLGVGDKMIFFLFLVFTQDQAQTFKLVDSNYLLIVWKKFIDGTVYWIALRMGSVYISWLLAKIME